jgi:osmoprotectant transport system ATP-binding protein
MQRGGILLQYSPPAELLLRPVNDYVAEFVGADRVLKSLALIRVGDLTAHSEVPAVPSLPRLPETMNARDALAQLLSVPEHAGAVVASDGRVVGTVTVEDIEATLAIQANLPSPAPLGDTARST